MDQQDCVLKLKYKKYWLGIRHLKKIYTNNVLIRVYKLGILAQPDFTLYKIMQ